MNADLRLTHCVLCGSPHSPAGRPVYALDEDAVLCFPCAVQRGGVYDDLARSWIALPVRSGLPLPADNAPNQPRGVYFAQRVEYAAS